MYVMRVGQNVGQIEPAAVVLGVERYPFDEAKATEFCEIYATGGSSWAEICKRIGVPERSVRTWLARYPIFQGMYAVARERLADQYVKEAIDIADDRSGDFKEDSKGRTVVDWENVNRSKLRVETRKWAATRLNPGKWGDKLTVENNVNVRIEESFQDRTTRMKALIEEYRSRGGDVSKLLQVIGVPLDEVKTEHKKQKRLPAVDAEYREETGKDQIP